MKGSLNEYEDFQEILGTTDKYELFDKNLIQDLIQIDNSTLKLYLFAMIPYLIKLFVFIHYMNSEFELRTPASQRDTESL